MKICLKCLQYYNDDMNFCPECAGNLTPVDASNQVGNYTQKGQMNTAAETPDSYYENRTVYGGAGANTYNSYANNNMNELYGAGNSRNNNVPPIQNENDFRQPQIQPVQNNGSGNNGGNKGLYILIAIFAAIIVVSGIIILVLLMSNGENEPSHGHEAEENLTKAVEVVVEETTTQPVTQVPTTAYQLPTERFSAYNTFNSFYVSYLDSINFMDSSYLGYCSETVRYEMIERFQYNSKSLFDLRRIDFDEDSYTSYTSGGKRYHDFYVKCVSEYYDRASYANKGYNYAIWYVTVTQEGDYYYVSYLERNDKYVMSTNIHTITDSVVLNYSYF